MADSIIRKYNFALIGCGSIAEKHIVALKRLKNAEVVAAFDIDTKATNRLLEKHNIATFNNLEKMMNSCEIDVFNILTPSGLHGKNILDLINYNKHFVVEKPLALRLDEVDRILEECDKRRLKIFVVKQNRFNLPIQKLKEAIDVGRFGKLVIGTVRVRWFRDQAYYDQKKWRGTRKLDGGVLTNQASHHIDMLLWMMGDVENVMAKTDRRLLNIETEDTGVAILKFKNGALGVIEATTATRPKDLEGSISILGEKGSVEIGGFFMNELKTWNFQETHHMDKCIWEKFSKVPDEFAWSHCEFFKDVIESIKNDKKGLIDGFEGRRSIELINAIYESSKTGKGISLKFKTINH